jgi:anti-anti-sigma regulatory factor
MYMEKPSVTLPSRAFCCPACGAQLSHTQLDCDGDNPCPACGRPIWFASKAVGDAKVLLFLPGLIAGGQSLERLPEVLEATQHSSHVVINLSPMRYVTSVFLNMLILLRRKVVQRGGAVAVCGLQGVSLEVAAIAQITSILAPHADEATALRACGSSVGSNGAGV